MPDYTPIETPKSLSENPHIQDLTEEQENKKHKVLAHFSHPDYKFVGEADGLTEDEKFWLSTECMLRYLRASKWVLPTAIQRLEETLKWRREYGLYDMITPEHVEPEALTGKMISFGFDTKGKPALYMIPSRQNTDVSPRQIHFTVWMLERAIDQMGPGVESLVLMINFADKAKNPSMGTARTVLNILQSHYPERLGLALIINVPMLVNVFLKMIMPFVDPVTRAKVKINPQIFEEGIMAKDMVMSEWWGGDCDFVYDHDKYWPELVQHCEARKQEQMDRWRQLGGHVGISEWEVKGGSATPDANTMVAEKTEASAIVETPNPQLA